jgi:hypothetical protein
MSEEPYEPSELHKRASQVFVLMTGQVVKGCNHLHEWEARNTTVAVCGYCVDMLRCYECHMQHLLWTVHDPTYCDVHPDRLAVTSEQVVLDLDLIIEPTDGWQGRYVGKVSVMPCIHWCERCRGFDGPGHLTTPAA